MRSYACMTETVDTKKDSFINRMMARNISQFRLQNSCNRKKNLVQLKNLIVTLIVYTQFFHLLVLLKNYDRRRLKHKLEFLCSHLAHLELILNFLARVCSFVSLFSSVPSPCYINNKEVYCDQRITISKSFVMLLLQLMRSLCRIEFRFYDYITMEHTLTFEITFT